jgi:recombinational DNA repair protein (RecF pathway)
VATRTFSGIRASLPKGLAAARALRLVKTGTEIGQADPAFFAFLAGWLADMDAEADERVPWLWGQFLTRWTAQQGIVPVMDRCVLCGARHTLVGVSARDGGMVCAGCAERAGEYFIPAGGADVAARAAAGILSYHTGVRVPDHFASDEIKMPPFDPGGENAF